MVVLKFRAKGRMPTGSLALMNPPRIATPAEIAAWKKRTAWDALNEQYPELVARLPR